MSERIPVIGVSGGSGAGKSTFVQEWMRRQSLRATLVSQDAYYRCLDHLSLDQRSAVNFDHPDALEASLLADNLAGLIAGGTIDEPIYDFAHHTRAGYRKRKAEGLIILEGTLIYALPAIAPLFSYRIFVDAPADIRLLRRLKRDMHQRGRTFAYSAEQYLRTVRPMHLQFIEPHRERADLVLDGAQPVEQMVDAASRSVPAEVLC